jgi:hypothetical protein
MISPIWNDEGEEKVTGGEKIMLSIGSQQITGNRFPQDIFRPGLARGAFPALAVLLFGRGRPGVDVRKEQEACGSRQDYDKQPEIMITFHLGNELSFR